MVKSGDTRTPIHLLSNPWRQFTQRANARKTFHTCQGTAHNARPRPTNPAESPARDPAFCATDSVPRGMASRTRLQVLHPANPYLLSLIGLT